MRKKILKVLGLLLLVITFGGAGVASYEYFRLKSVIKVLEAAKSQRVKKRNQQTVGSASLPYDSERISSAAPGVSENNKDTSQKKPQTQASAHTTACTEVYQKYIENRKFTEVVTAVKDEVDQLFTDGLEEDPCFQLLTDVIDLDHVESLVAACQGGNLLTDDSKKACLTLMTLGWGAFAEAEFRDKDPVEIPQDALHSKIIFRLIEKDEFLNKAVDKDKIYLFRLMDQLHKLNPKIDYGTTREELVAEFYAKDPKTWDEDYSRILEELESFDIMRAVVAFYNGHGQKMNQEFFDYVDGIAKRHPKDQLAHFYKSCAYTGIKDWENASLEALEAERLEPDLNKKLFPPLRKAISEKRPYLYTGSWISISIDMPSS